MCIEKICRISAVAADLGIEINTTTFKAACFQEYQHYLCQFIDVVWELIGIPAILVITAIGIHASKQTCVCSHLYFVLESMPGKRCMIYFKIQFKIIEQVVLPQKADHRCTVIIVLVLGRLAGLRLDKERTLETLSARILLSGMEESGQVLLLRADSEGLVYGERAELPGGGP